MTLPSHFPTFRRRQGLSHFLVFQALALVLLIVSGVTAHAQLLGSDYGDAPAPYPTTLRDNGARHQAVGPQLGALRDTENDGIPDPSALGDNNSATNDEDGIVFLSRMVPGQIATIQVTVASAPNNARLDAWIDFDINGSWAETSDHIFTARVVTNGVNVLTFFVPQGAKAGTTFARFRISTTGDLAFTGAAPDGEVEDYQVAITDPMDFGDAPRPYPTLLADNGARHRIVQGFSLGSRIDAEPDGQPNANATGDDTPSAGGPGDEDGVVFTTPLRLGQFASVQVTCTVPPVISGRLNAWIDFNGNGNWTDPGEQIFTDLIVGNGVTNLNFLVPATATGGTTFARFRLNASGKIGPTGAATEGEVEDYQVSIISDRDRCDLDCDGREFWLSFPGNYAPDPANPARLSLCLHGSASSGGIAAAITVPGIGFSTNVIIPAGLSATVPLPRAAELGDLIDVVTNRAIHVTASAPISITAFNHATNTTDSYLALNTSVLGTAYVAMGFGNLQTGVPQLNGSQFAIVATASNTTVAITPSVTTAGHPAGLPYTIVMQAGDTYQLRNTNDAPSDLSGTLIKADKPIAVFGGHQCTTVPSSNAFYCNYLVEQLLPVNTWGNEFYTVPFATRTAGYSVRLLAAFDGTVVSSNGVPLGILNRGQFMQSQQSTGVHFTATSPIFVSQYSPSSDFDGNTNSDPSMLTVQAVRHYSSSYRICAASADFPTNYVNLVAPAAVLANIQIDGVTIPSSITPIPGTTYSYARVLIAPGMHTVLNTKGAPFGAYVYGWAEYDAYAHPACFFFGDVSAPQVAVVTNAVSATVSTNSSTAGSAAVPNVVAGAQTQDNCSAEPITPTQTPKAGTLLGPGLHAIAVIAVDASGNSAETNITFAVIDPSPVVITCPTNLIVNCTSSDGAIVNFSVSAHTTYDPNVTVVSTPASGSVFPIGTTVVNSVATSLAGQSSKCSFTVTVRCETNTNVRINAARSKDGLVMTWSGTATLEFTPDLNTKWSSVTNGVNTYTAPVTGKAGYYRLRF